jgi:DNA-binding MarR family transcriptional regulator
MTARAQRSPARPRPTAAPASTEEIDASFLESLLGYNARRAALAILEVLGPGLAAYDLRPVDFSVLSLITHNPGITSRQLCGKLGILPPNVVGMVNSFEERRLISRSPYPGDRRAMGLHLTAAGEKLMREAERTVARIEGEVAFGLTPLQRRTLIGLLKRIYS